MAVIETTEPARISALLAHDPLLHLEAIDESVLGVQGIVSVFAEDVEHPANLLVIRWAQSALGLRNAGVLSGRRLTGLEDVVRAMPGDRGHVDLLLPFWASPAVAGSFKTVVQGAEAVYLVDRARLAPSPVAAQCQRVIDLELLKPKFRKLADDLPAYVLSLRGQLMAVAAVTHHRSSIARLSIYTVEEARGRGFGRGVLTALAESVLALGITPSVRVDLGHEPSVRMVERAGFVQHGAFLAARVEDRIEDPPEGAPPSRPSPGGLVQLGKR